jgi:ribosomal 50S subunit-recycling heat shock protein
MRVDLFLKYCHLTKRRNEAKREVESEEVRINGKICKPATKIKVGDEIEIDFEKATIKFKVILLPQHPIKRSEQDKYLILVEKKQREIFESD